MTPIKENPMTNVQGGDVVVTTESVKTWLKDTGERVLSTAVQAFLTLIVVSGGIDLSAKNAAYSAAITAGFVALKQAVVAVTLPVFSNRWADLLSRAGWTFLQTAVTLLAVENFNWGDMSAWQGVGIAALAAALTVVKGFVASNVTNRTVTPASFVKPAEGQRLPAVV